MDLLETEGRPARVKINIFMLTFRLNYQYEKTFLLCLDIKGVQTFGSLRQWNNHDDDKYILCATWQPTQYSTVYYVMDIVG